MKKKSKTSKKTLKKTKTKVVKAAPEKAPEIEEGLISVAFTPEDLRVFANLMSITAKTFEKLAMDAAQGNDEAAFAVLQSRHRLCSLLANKFISSCRMPEPISRDFH